MSFKRTIIVLICLISTVYSYASVDFSEVLNSADAARTSDPQKFSQLLDSIESKSLTAEQLSLYNYLVGYRLGFSGDRAAARVKYLQVYNSAETDVRFRALASATSSYAFSGLWYEGIQKLNILVNELKNIEDKEINQQAMLSIATFYNRAGEHSLAKRFSENLLLMNPPPRTSCNAHGNLIEALLVLPEEEISSEFYQDALVACRAANEPVLEAIVTSYYSDYLLKRKQVAESLLLLGRYEDLVESTGYPSLISGYSSVYASASFQAGNHQKALELAKRAIDLQKSNNYQSAVISAYKTRSQLAEIEGDYSTALHFHKKYVEAETGYAETAKNRKFIIQQANHEAIEKNNRISLLDKQNALLRAESQLSKKQAENNRLALSLAGSLVILLFLWIYRSKKLQTKLRYLAETDDLTGISNRHHFNRLSDEFLNQSQLNQQPISFILFDLDHFKKVNDNFGHQIGDWALKNSVIAAKAVCRGNDVIGRMGGEEFAILLPGCTLVKALQVAELCRLAIEEIDSAPTGKQFKITASFGVSDSDTCGYHFDKLFAGADSALYQSKNHGRNQIYQYNEVSLTPS